MKPVYIPDIIGEVVTTAKNADYQPGNGLINYIRGQETLFIGLSSLITTLNYQYGHIEELLQTLKEYDKVPNQADKRFPLVWLVTDFPEEHGQTIGVYAEVSLNIVIMHQSKAEYKSTERLQNVFKPVLYPIYYQLMKYLAKHPAINVSGETMIPHRKTDRFYWGTKKMGSSGQTVLNDYVDAIDIQNLKLKINYKSGC